MFVSDSKFMITYPNEIVDTSSMFSFLMLFRFIILPSTTPSTVEVYDKNFLNRSKMTATWSEHKNLDMAYQGDVEIIKVRLIIS